jgi:hypothetical protein
LREACVIHADALVQYGQHKKPPSLIEKEEKGRIDSLMARHEAAMLLEEKEKAAKATFIDDDRQLTRVAPLSKAQKIAAEGRAAPVAPSKPATVAEQIAHQQSHPPSRQDIPIDQSYGVRPIQTAPAPAPASAPVPAPAPAPASAPAPAPAPSQRALREEPNRENDMRYPPGTVFPDQPEPGSEVSTLRSTVQKLEAEIAGSSRPKLMSEFHTHLKELLSRDKRTIEACQQMEQYNLATRDLLLKFTADADKQQDELKAAKDEAARVTAENAEHVKAKRKYKRETKMRKEKALE